MMNIILIEDEPPILRGLQGHIRRYPENFGIKGAFTNAKDALQYLEGHAKDVDVAITDIELPLINGLSFIERIQGKYPHITCIILSGYDNFEYARSAIRLGVSNYLTKPVDTAELHKTLLDIYEKKCMDSILKPPVPEQEPAALSFSDEYALAIVCDGNESYFNPTPHSDIYDYEYHPRNFYAILGPDRDMPFKVSNGRSCYETIIFLHMKGREGKPYPDRLLDFFSPLLKQQTNFTVVFSRVPAKLGDIGQYMQSMRYCLYKSIIIGKPQLLHYLPDQWEEPQFTTDTFREDVYHLERVFENGDAQLFRQGLCALLTRLKEASCNQLNVFHCLNLLACACLKKQPQTRPGLSIPELINDAIFYSSDYDALLENLLSVFLEECAEDSQNRGSILEKIDHYIRQHYMEPLNTRQLAETFHFTPSYLSKMFREYKDISPIEYIIRLKVEKAKELLAQNPSMPVKECAALIGYADPLYFSKVFKKVTGMSPKQYVGEVTA